MAIPMVIPLIIYSVMLKNAFVKHFKAVAWFFKINQFYGFYRLIIAYFSHFFNLLYLNIL